SPPGLAVPVGGLIVIYQSYDATRFWRTLETADTISDLPLPAGSRIQFADRAHSIVVLIELPHVTEILSMRLAGTLQPWKRQGNAVTHWGGNLHGYQIIDGLPCKGGPYVNDKSGGVLFRWNRQNSSIHARCAARATRSEAATKHDGPARQ